MKKEYHISECCKAPLFFKGEGKGLWCSNCKKEVTETIVAIGEKEIKELKIFSKLYQRPTFNKKQLKEIEEREAEENSYKQKKSMEERFEEKFMYDRGSYLEFDLMKAGNVGELLNFVKAEINLAQEEERKRIMQTLEEMKKDPTLGMNKTGLYEIDNFNQALTQVTTKINKLNN